MRKKGIPRKNGRYMKLCGFCGQEFATLYPIQKTCGKEECTQKRKEKYLKRYTPVTHACESCGVLIKSKAREKLCLPCKEQKNKKYCEYCGAEIKAMGNKKTCDKKECKEKRRKRNTGWHWVQTQKEKLANGVGP